MTVTPWQRILSLHSELLYLLINKLFLSQIAKVAAKLKNKDISCIVNHAAGEKLEYIVNCLKLANI